MNLLRCTLMVGIILFSIRTNAQQKENTMTKEVIVTKFLNGFNDPSKIKESLNLLCDEYRFTSPTESSNSKTEFVKQVQVLAKVLTGIEIKKIAVSGNWVCVNYVFTSSVKGLEATSGNEWFRIENGKIQESHLIYDATKWKKILDKMRN